MVAGFSILVLYALAISFSCLLERDFVAIDRVEVETNSTIIEVNVLSRLVF